MCVCTELSTSVRPSASGDCPSPLVDVSSPSAVISPFCGSQRQAWCCKTLSPGSNGPGWDKYPGRETKSTLMSLAVQSVLNLFLQNARPRRVMERGHSSLGGPGPSCAVPRALRPLQELQQLCRAAFHRNKVYLMTRSSFTRLLETWNMKTATKWIPSCIFIGVDRTIRGRSDKLLHFVFTVPPSSSVDGGTVGLLQGLQHTPESEWD